MIFISKKCWKTDKQWNQLNDHSVKMSTYEAHAFNCSAVWNSLKYCNEERSLMVNDGD